MRKADLLFGALIGMAACVLGSWLFIVLFTDYGFVAGISAMHQEGHLGKVITLGAILSIVIFFVLLKLNRELMARGVVLGLIVLTIITLFV